MKVHVGVISIVTTLAVKGYVVRDFDVERIVRQICSLQLVREVGICLEVDDASIRAFFVAWRQGLGCRRRRR